MGGRLSDDALHPAAREKRPRLRHPVPGRFAVVFLLFASLTAARANDCPSPAAPEPGPLARTLERLRSGAPLRILAIGSSSTRGVGASSPGMAYPARLEAALEKAYPGRVTVINAGIGGELAAATVDRLGHEMELAEPDLVLWQVGTNDALTPAVSEEDFGLALEAGADLVARRARDLLLIDPQVFKSAANPGRYERFVALVGDLAHRRRLALFSRNKAMKFWEKAGAADDLVTRDGLHMNDKGYGCVAETLALEIERQVAGR